MLLSLLLLSHSWDFLLPLLAPDKVGGGGATRPLLRDGYMEELHGDPRSKPEVKNGVVPKMVCWRGSDARQSRRR